MLWLIKINKSKSALQQMSIIKLNAVSKNEIKLKRVLIVTTSRQHDGKIYDDNKSL